MREVRQLHRSARPPLRPGRCTKTVPCHKGPVPPYYFILTFPTIKPRCNRREGRLPWAHAMRLPVASVGLALVGVIASAAVVAEAGFTQARIGQNTPLAGASNLLTVTLVSDTTLTAAANSVITFSGLETATSVSTSVSLLAASAGNNAEQLFEAKAAVWSETGTLKCTLASGKTLAAGTSYSFSFVLINPSYAQAARAISIQASGTMSSLQTMTSDQGDLLGIAAGRAPLRTVVASFSTAFITQTTPLVQVVNYIIVFLQANINIPRGSRVSISGLNATSSPDEQSCFQMELFPHGQLFAPEGCARWTQASGLLEMTVQTDLRASDVYQIVFPVLNPPTAQASPHVEISGEIDSSSAEVRGLSGYRVAQIALRDMQKDDTTTFGLPSGANVLKTIQNRMLLQHIRQDYPLAKGNNTITVMLRSLTDMPMGSRITLSGLTGSSTPSTDKLPVVVNSEFMLQTAEWNATVGSVVFETAGINGLPSGFLSTLRFVLINQDTQHTGTGVWLSGFVESSSGDTQSNTVSASPLVASRMAMDDEAVLGIANGSNPITCLPLWSVKNISQSTSVVEALNTITVSIQLNVRLDGAEDKSMLTISGLTSSLTPTSQALPLTYPSEAEHHFFGSSAQWIQSSGTLILKVANTSAGNALGAEELYSFSFLLRNPSTGQAEARVSVETLGLLDMMDAGDILLAPLAVTDFTTKFIQQQTAAPGFSNRISITLSTSTNLPAEYWGGGEHCPQIVVCCLTGFSSPDDLFVSAPPELLLYSWSLQTGRLVLKVDADLQADQVYSISFFALNSLVGQDSPSINISAFVFIDGQHAVLIDRVMDKGQDELAPLIINEFTVHTISQTTTFHGADNTITVSFSTRTPLRDRFNEGALVLICNMVGPLTPSDPTLPITDIGNTGVHTDVATTGAWTRDMFNVNYQPWRPGCLVLEVQETQANKVYAFSFTMTNSYSPSGQFAPDIYIHLFRKNRFSWTFVMEKIMSPAPGNARAFLLQGLASSLAFQSSSQKAAQNNMINITFVTRAAFSPPAVLTFSNLLAATVDAVTQQQGLQITTSRPNQSCPDCTHYFGNASSVLSGGSSGYASWNSVNAGDDASAEPLAFSLYVMSEVPPGAYMISFRVRNPRRSQLPPTLKVEASSAGEVIFKRVAMTSAPLLDAPMAIFGYNYLSIGQSNASAGARNTLTVTFQPLISLDYKGPVKQEFGSIEYPTPPQILLSPLTGAEEASGNLSLSEYTSGTSGSACGTPACVSYFGSHPGGEGVGQAIYDNTAKTLAVYVTRVTGNTTNYTLSFEVNNPGNA